MNSRLTYDSDRDAGFTVVELMVVSVLLVLVLGVGFVLMDTSGRMVNQAEATSVASDEARLALDKLGMELRQSQEVTDTAGIFATNGMQSRQMIFYVDLKHDNYMDRVTYYMSGDSLMRKETSSTTPIGIGSPNFRSPESTPKIMVQTISPTYSGAIFSYFKPDGTTATLSKDCSAVSIRLIDQKVAGKVTVNVDLSTWAKLRSVLNSIN